MRYVGGKAKLAKHLIPLIPRPLGSLWVEPFMGGGGMITAVSGPRWGNDNHRYLMAMWQKLQDGWDPPGEVSEELYREVRKDPGSYPPELVGFVGHAASFGCKWWGGFARGKTPEGVPRNYPGESRRRLLKFKPLLEGVKLTCLDYRDMKIPDEAVVYLDPPYAGTQSYRETKWDAGEFWRWAEQLSQRCSVWVSEFQAPSGWRCVWEKERAVSLDKNTGGKVAIERLYTR